MATILQEDLLTLLLKRVSFGDMDELYAAIGYGGITATKAVNRICDELTRINRLHSARQWLKS